MALLDLYFTSPRLGGPILAILLVTAFTLVAVLGFGRRDLVGRAALASSGASFAMLAANLLLGVWTAAAYGSMVGLYRAAGLPHLADSAWDLLPFWLALLLTLVARDIKNYASHRWLHGRLGWPIHAIHHSDAHVNGLTAFRIHPLEIVVMHAFRVVLFGWLGTPPAIAAAAVLVAMLYDLYVHTDTDIEHGPLRRILASPRFHRWHHLDNPAAYTTNLAGMFSFLDVIFGTYREPVRLPDRPGAATAGVPTDDVARLLLFPFVEWGRMIRQRPPVSA